MRSAMRAAFVLGAVLALGLGVASASQCGQMCGGGSGPGPEFRHTLARLDLTDQQREQVDKLFAQTREQRPAMHKEMMRLQHALRGEMLADEPELGKLRKIVEDISGLRTRMQVARFEMMLNVRKLLTPEQRDRLWSLGCGPGAMLGMGSGMGCGCDCGGPGCCEQQCCGEHRCGGAGQGCCDAGPGCRNAGQGCRDAGPGCRNAGQGCGQGAPGGHGCMSHAGPGMGMGMGGCSAHGQPQGQVASPDTPAPRGCSHR